MDFTTLIRQRFSVLDYLHQPVSPELVRSILDAGLAAPTACNLQPQRILVIDDDASRAKLNRVVPSRVYVPQATALGLGSIWVMSWDPAQIKQEFSLDGHLEPTALLVVGHKSPDATPHKGHFISKTPEEVVIS